MADASDSEDDKPICVIKQERDTQLETCNKKPAFVQMKEMANTTWYKVILGSYKAALDKRKAAIIKRVVETDEEKQSKG